ncbi:hypothetical protein KR059_006447 [Drosophila kikkawai]|nr:hypothetical protein KR059_006447 [Drosophila kikkawai]
MWSDRWTVLAGESFEVFCSCNGSEIQVEDLHIQKGLEERYLETSIVDEITIKHRVEHVREQVSFNTACRYRDQYLGGILVVVIPLLQVQEFQCLVESADREASCTFKDVGRPEDNSLRKQRYFLGIDEEPSVPCWEMSSNHSWIQCNGIKLPDKEMYKFRLSMDYEGYTQSQDFQFKITEISVPAWTPYKPNFLQNSSHICLQWVHTDENSLLAWPQEWRVQFNPQSPKLQPYVDQLIVYPDITMYFELNCFKIPPHSNQAYRLRFSRRYYSTRSPWSSELDFPELTTAATGPDRPPELLTNGFYHDPEKKELYLFWRQLDELELNGPNFTYAAVTDEGKNPSSINKNSALFSHWDTTLPAVIYVWSQNSVGSSTNRTRLQVPLLTNSEYRQPLELWYHDDIYALTWQPPQDQQGLTGYAISWCWSSSNQICDDQESIQNEMVKASQTQFHFNQSMLLSHLAVAACYKDKPSGGMKWTNPTWVRFIKSWEPLGLSHFMLGMITLIMIVFIIILWQKLRSMSQIEVDIPEILLKGSANAFVLSQTDHPATVAVPGNFSPKTIMNINNFTMEMSEEPEPKIEVIHIPYRNMFDKTSEACVQDQGNVYQKL